MKTLKFQSKVDTWLAATLVVAAGATSWSAVQSGQWLPVALTVGVFAVFLFPMRYELRADALVIRAGLIRYRRPYAGITAVTPNRNPLSAPALSLDRVLVTSRERFGVNISPADRAKFLAALAERAPHLVHTNDGGLATGKED